MMDSKTRAIAATCVAALLAAPCALAAALETEEAPPPPEEIRTHHVGLGLHVLAGAGGNVVVWSGTDGVVLVDDGLAPWTPELLEAVGRVAPGPVRFVVNTHWHPDHTGGNEHLGRAGAVLVAHEHVRSRMNAPQVIEPYGLKVPAADSAALPVVTFSDEISLNLNGDRLEAVHVVDAHTDGDVVVRWEAANVVHTGGVYVSDAYPFIDRSSGGSLAGLVAAIEGILARTDAGTVVVPGHGPVSDRAGLAAYRDMVVTVGRRVRELVEQGRSLDEVLAARPTAAFDEAYGRGSMSPDRFVGILYQDLASRR